MLELGLTMGALRLGLTLPAGTPILKSFVKIFTRQIQAVDTGGGVAMKNVILGSSTSALKSLNPTESNLRVALEIDKKSPVQGPWTKSTQPRDTRKFFVRDSNTMPEISRFLGVVIRMFYRDHAPPHFHAEYSDYEITVDIETGVVEGKFPKRALRAVLEWADIHRDDLLADWHLARLEPPLNSIEPLE